MRTRLQIATAMRMTAAVLVLGTLGFTWGASRTEAVIAIIRSTGLFSLAPGQGTIAHVVNTANKGIAINWRVLDESGAVLAESEDRRLAPNEADSFDFSPSDLRAAQRLTIRVVLTLVDRSRGPHEPGFIATQEVFNTASGRTTVVLPYIEQ